MGDNMAACHEVKRFSLDANATQESMGSTGQQHVLVCQFWLSILALVCRGRYPFFWVVRIGASSLLHVGFEESSFSIGCCHTMSSILEPSWLAASPCQSFRVQIRANIPRLSESPEVLHGLVPSADAVISLL